MIKKLYKYRPILDDNQLQFAKDVLKNKRFYLSPLEHFSDPFDSINKDASESVHLKSFSISENADSRLLWSYYAGWYNGIMIAVEIDLTSPPFEDLKQIKYLSSETELIDKIRDGNFLVKSLDFEHEMEWRVIMGGENNFISFSSDQLKDVTIGPSLKMEYRAEIVELCRRLNIPAFEYYQVNKIPVLSRKNRIL